MAALMRKTKSKGLRDWISVDINLDVDEDRVPWEAAARLSCVHIGIPSSWMVRMGYSAYNNGDGRSW